MKLFLGVLFYFSKLLFFVRGFHVNRSLQMSIASFNYQLFHPASNWRRPLGMPEDLAFLAATSSLPMASDVAKRIVDPHVDWWAQSDTISEQENKSSLYRSLRQFWGIPNHGLQKRGTCPKTRR